MINLDQTPHPLIEDHHHIRELIYGQEKRHADRLYHRERVKSLQERDELIEETKYFAVTDFWCDKCKEDFRGMAVKQIENDWNSSNRIAYYKTKCFRGHWCIRLITDKHTDGFFQRSKLVFLDRGNHFNDTVQPHETGFNLLYGKRS